MTERHVFEERAKTETLSYGPLHETVGILRAAAERRFSVSAVPGTRRATVGFAAAFRTEDEAGAAHRELRQRGYESQMSSMKDGCAVVGQREFAIAEVRDLAQKNQEFLEFIPGIDASLARDRADGLRMETLGDERDYGELYDVYDILRDRNLRIDNRFRLSPKGDLAYITMYGTFGYPDQAVSMASGLNVGSRVADSRGKSVRVHGPFSVAEIRALADLDVRFYVLAIEMQQQIEASREALESERQLREAVEYDEKHRRPSMAVAESAPEKKTSGKLHEAFAQLNKTPSLMVQGMAHSVGPGSSASLQFNTMFSTPFEADRVRKALEQAGYRVSAGSDSRTVMLGGTFEVAEIRGLADRDTRFARLMEQLERDVQREQARSSGPSAGRMNDFDRKIFDLMSRQDEI